MCTRACLCAGLRILLLLSAIALLLSEIVLPLSLWSFQLLVRLLVLLSEGEDVGPLLPVAGGSIQIPFWRPFRL